jgi:hypothetical protein
MPLFFGDKFHTVQAIKRLNELSVTLVSVYVLLTFFDINYGCDKTFCYSLYMGLGADRAGTFTYTALCETDRYECFQTLVKPGKCVLALGALCDALFLVVDFGWNTFKPPAPIVQTPTGPYSLAMNYSWENAYCYCLMKIKTQTDVTAQNFLNLTHNDVDLYSEPEPTCNESLTVLLIILFASGTVLVGVGEITLANRRAAILLLVSVSVYYAITIGSMFGARTSCPGVVYEQKIYVVLYLCIAGYAVAVCGLIYMIVTDRTRCCDGKLITYKKFDGDMNEQTLLKAGIPSSSKADSPIDFSAEN